MSEEDSASSPLAITEEKKFIVHSDKENEMDLYLRNYNNEEFSISILTKNEYPSKKYELKCDLEKIQKNRFFKIFINFEEIMKELENKIKESTIIEEDNNLINIEIPIGLTVINHINLELKKVEKTAEEINNELLEKMQEQKNEIENLKNKIEELNNIINELRNRNNIINNQINEKNNNLNKNNQEINKLNQNIEILKKKENELNNKIKDLEINNKKLKDENKLEKENIKRLEERIKREEENRKKFEEKERKKQLEIEKKPELVIKGNKK